MRKKIVLPIICIALIVGILSGCVEENKAPTASFDYTPTDNIYMNTVITFADASTDEDGTIESWSWDFGDDMTSTEQNPTHSYTAVDTYTVTLNVTDDDGATHITTMDISVVYRPLTADFQYEATELSVNFSDASEKGDFDITSWEWDFGDGNTSNETSPTHTYAAAGDYEVTLTITDENDVTATKTETITVE